MHVSYLVDHVDHAHGLDLHLTHVVPKHHLLPRPALLGRQHAHFLEQLDVLGRVDAGHGFHVGVDAAQAVGGEHLLVLGVIAVAVEDHFPVLLEGVLGVG